MKVNKLPRGHAHWDYDGDGQFNCCIASGKKARHIRKWWVRQQKRRMDDTDE